MIINARDGMSGNLDYSALFSAMDLYDLEKFEKMILLEAVKEVENKIKENNKSNDK